MQGKSNQQGIRGSKSGTAINTLTYKEKAFDRFEKLRNKILLSVNLHV